MPSPFLLLALAPTIGSPGSSVPLSVALEDPPELHQWDGAFNAAAIVTDGNTVSRSSNAAFDAVYRREKDRFTFGAWWNYQDDTTGILQRRTGAHAKYDYFFSKTTFGVVRTSIENDFAADLERRWIFGLGLGHQFVESETSKFSAEAGVAWYDEHLKPNLIDDYFAAYAAYKWDWTISKAWVFFHGGEIYPSLEDQDDVYSKLDTRLRVNLTEKMFAQAQWVMDWDNTPAPGKEPVDNRYIVSVGWAF